MHYFKRIFLALSLIVVFSHQTYAFYHTKWIKVFENQKLTPKGINSVSIDADSVNIHNDSIYYAISYSYYEKNAQYPKGYVSIIQSKNNMAGIVETYEYNKYDELMQNSTNNLHPAYVAKEAKNLKILDNASFIYNANEKAKEIVEIKKHNPASINLFNGLYGQ